MEYKRPKSNLRKLGNRFEMIEIVGKGTFGCVYKAFKPKNPKKFYALKKISLQKEIGDGFPFTSIREIKLLKELKHQNIVQMTDIFKSKGFIKRECLKQLYFVNIYGS